MTLDEIRNADEMTLRNRLAELRGIKRTRKLTTDEQDEGRYRAAASKMMEFDPTGAMGLLARADQIKATREKTAQDLKDKTDINSVDNIKQIAIQYRATLASFASDTWRNLPQSQKNDMIAQSKGLKAQLAKTELGRALLGQVESEAPVDITKTVVPPAPVTGGGQEVTKATIEDLFKQSQDADRDGQADNAPDIDGALAILAGTLGETDKDVLSLKAKWASMQQGFEKKAEKRTADEQKQYERRQSYIKRKAAIGTLLQGLKDLKKAPESLSAKSSVMTSILRSESGAAIAQSEFGQRMLGWLGEKEFNNMVEEMNGLGVLIAGRISSNAAELMQGRIMNKYLAKVPGSSLYTFGAAKVDDDIREKELSGSGGNDGNGGEGDKKADKLLEGL